MSKNHAQYFLMFNLSPSNPKLICHPGFCSAGIPRLLIFLNVRSFKNQTNAIIVTIHLLTLVPHKSSYHVRQKPQFQCETHIRIITVSLSSGEDLSGQGVRFPGPLEGPLHIHLPTKSPTKNIQLKYKYKAKVTILLSIIYIYRS